MTALVRVLTVSAVDSSPSLLLVSPNGSKILVNCGEGCQRAFLEYSQRLSTVKAICLTHLNHAATGGLPGAILTMAEAAKQPSKKQDKGMTESPPASKQKQPNKNISNNNNTRPLCLVGPRGTQRYIHSLRHFINRPDVIFDVNEAQNVTTGLHVSKQQRCNSNKKQQHKGNKNGKKPRVNLADMLDFTIETVAVNCQVDQHTHDSSVPATQMDGSKKRPRPKQQQQQQQVVSYLFTTPPIPGSFHVDKAIQLGVPRGPLYARLKAGETVKFQNKDGTERLVESSQVVSPSSPAIAMQVLYYPTEDVAHALFEKVKSKLLDGDDDGGQLNLEVVVHIASPDLFHRVGLPFWKDQAENIFVSTDRADALSPYRSSVFGGTVRSLLSPDIYPKPFHPPANQGKASATSPDGFRHATPLLEYVALPRARRGFHQPTCENTVDPSDEALDLATTCGALDAGREIVSKNTERTSTTPATSTHKEAAIIFTGTGSAVPCKHRNVSGILLRQSDGRGILLDVGEGTVGQLLRVESTSNEPQHVLSNIVAVFISHPHADHHLGLIRLLEDRPATAPPLQIVAPPPIFRFLEEYAAVTSSSIGTKYTAILNQELVAENHTCDGGLYQAMGIRARTVSVTHCQHAYAVVLDQTDFGRVVYSGDCRPSTKLAATGKGADVLIHEATFEDGMEAEAVLKRHCTIGQALAVAKDMKAKQTILTHFSQRYPKFPHLNEQHDASIIVAFDYMRLRQSQFKLAPLLNPALRLLYPEVAESDDEALGQEAQNDQAEAKATLAVPGLFANGDLL